jgi:hypothetical protein
VGFTAYRALVPKAFAGQPIVQVEIQAERVSRGGAVSGAWVDSGLVRMFLKRPAEGQCIEGLGRNVRAVRPADGSAVRPKLDSGELGGLAQLGEDAREIPEQGRKVDGSLHAILETEVKAVAAENAHLNHVTPREGWG